MAACDRKCFNRWQETRAQWPGFVVGVKAGKYLAFWGDNAREVNQLLGGGALPKVGGMADGAGYTLEHRWL